MTRSSVLQCRMIQPMPYFGRVIFDQSAGKPLRFYLQSLANLLERGRGSLQSLAPRWNPDLPRSF